jgi:hypothetical protein
MPTSPEVTSPKLRNAIARRRERLRVIYSRFLSGCDAHGGKCRRQRAPCVWRATEEPDGWRNRSSGPAVPLSRIQTEILRLLAAYRDPESYVAEAAPLNRDAPCVSGDVDRVSRSRGEGCGGGIRVDLDQIGPSHCEEPEATKQSCAEEPRWARDCFAALAMTISARRARAPSA